MFLTGYCDILYIIQRFLFFTGRGMDFLRKRSAMDFSISQLSPAVSKANLNTDFGIKMLAKTMDNNEEVGENIVKMIDSAAMERSVNPNVGGNFDMSV